MSQEMTFDDIAAGEIGIADARRIIAAQMRDMDSAGALRIYASLKAWLWKAINGRRRDEELREWHDLMRRVAAGFSEKHFAMSERVSALYEMLYESLTVSEILSTDEVMKRKHVQRIVRALYRQPDHTLERSALGEKLGLGQANLSRILILLQSAGLVEKTMHGKNAIFSLTPTGLQTARNHPMRFASASTSSSKEWRLAGRSRTFVTALAQDPVKAALIGHRLQSPGFSPMVERQYVKMPAPVYTILVETEDGLVEFNPSEDIPAYWDEATSPEQDVVVRVHIHE